MVVENSERVFEEINKAGLSLSRNMCGVKPSKNVSRSLPPPPPMVPKLPESGLPEGWSMEQWHYYGEEYIRRQK